MPRNQFSPSFLSNRAPMILPSFSVLRRGQPSGPKPVKSHKDHQKYRITWVDRLPLRWNIEGRVSVWCRITARDPASFCKVLKVTYRHCSCGGVLVCVAPKKWDIFITIYLMIIFPTPVSFHRGDPNLPGKFAHSEQSTLMLRYILPGGIKLFERKVVAVCIWRKTNLDHLFEIIFACDVRISLWYFLDYRCFYPLLVIHRYVQEHYQQ